MDLNFDELLGGEQEVKAQKKEGVTVKHKMKEAIKKILPEDFKILGKISILLEEVPGAKPKVKSRTFKDVSEFSKFEFGFFKNIRDLKSFDGTNPYDSMVKVEHATKESLKLNSEEDYKGLIIQSTKSDLFGRKTDYVNIWIFAPEAEKISLDELTTGLDSKSKGFGKRVV